MRVRELRFLTAVAIILVAGVLVMRGLPVMRYGLSSAARSGIGVDEAAMGTTGLAFDARRAALTSAREEDVQDQATVKRQSELIQSILERAPIDATDWLGLSQARAGAGQGLQEISAALALSNLTGPNEGLVMPGRAIMGMALWDRLAPDTQRTTMSDLIGGWPAATGEQQGLMRTLVLGASDKGREEMRAQLLLNGPEGTKIATALGFDEEQKPGAAAPAGPDAGSSGSAPAYFGAGGAASNPFLSNPGLAGWPGGGPLPAPPVQGAR